MQSSIVATAASQLYFLAKAIEGAIESTYIRLGCIDIHEGG